MSKRQKFPKQWLQLFAVLLILMSIPKGSSENIQGMAIAVLAPALEQLNHIKRGIQHLADETVPSPNGHIYYALEEIERLKLENRLLRNEINTLKQINIQESYVEQDIKDFANQQDALRLGSSLSRHQEQIKNLLELQITSIPALVIYRTPSSWTNSLWINVGTKTNKEIGATMIAKNSPVVFGRSIVGVVDYVGKKQSRVRLITDTGLTPSVRAVREEKGKTWFLGKGELTGCHTPRWRCCHHLLYGVGFNYDYADEEGPARDLRTGTPLNGEKGVPSLPIVQPGDLLITTGMDGVFPPFLHVATITHIDLLKEGDYFYTLQAKPTAGELDDLSLVFVLPPYGYNFEDRAPSLVRLE